MKPLIISIVSLLFTVSVGQDRAPEPDLHLVQWEVLDGIDGNGDGGLHPGETVQLRLTLGNFGNRAARDVAGQLSLRNGADPEVELLDKVAFWPDIDADALLPSDTPDFTLRIATTLPCESSVALQLELSAADGYLQTLDFDVPLANPRDISIAERPGRPTIYGSANSSNLGRLLAAGDFDGDGYDDIAVGERFSVRIVYGQADPPADVDLASPTGPLTTIVGSEVVIPRSLAFADRDGDGRDELVIASGDTPTRWVGVIYGRPDRPATIDTDNDFGVFGLATTDSAFGGALHGVDLNADRYEEIVIGSAIDDGDITILWGEVFPDSGVSDPATFEPATRISGIDPLDNLGSALASGDLDGDGIDDLVVIASGGDGPGNLRPGAGEATVIYGSTTQPGDQRIDSPGLTTTVVYPAVGDGIRVIAAGDTDGDARDELVIGAQRGLANINFAGGGVAYVLDDLADRPPSVDLANPDRGLQLIGAGFDYLGFSSGDVAIGDLDGDGLAEVVLANSRVYPAVLDLAGEVGVFSTGPVQGPDLRFDQPPVSARFYRSETPYDLLLEVAIGDFNGDGIGDLAMGAEGRDGPADEFRPDAGEVIVIPGEPRLKYRNDPATVSFIDATSGTDLGLACDDCSLTIPIGFAFDYFGRSRTEVTVSSNGYLTFGGPGDQPYGRCMPSTAAPDEVIAVFWDDLNLENGGAIYSLLEGTAPNRRLTIQWDAVPAWPNVGAGTFEVTLFETSNQILMQYQDTTFGGAMDLGATAVAGIENATGTFGKALSCFADQLDTADAARFSPYGNPTVVFRDDMESGVNGWTGSGWQLGADCAPNAFRSDGNAWFLSDPQALCTVYSGIGDYTLTSPLLPTLAQDAELRFWQRRGAEDDQANLRVQAGGMSNFLASNPDASDQWKFSGDFAGSAFEAADAFSLAPYVGQDVALQFEFVDEGDSDVSGWFIDDVEVRACPVWTAGGGSAAATEARATAERPAYCEGEVGRVDAIGSYCTACSTLTYQWRRDDVDLPGETGPVLTLDAGEPPANSRFSVEVGCDTADLCDDVSEPVDVRIVQEPDLVGPSLRMGKTDDLLTFQWTDVGGAGDYLLRSGLEAIGGFATIAGSVDSGATGLALAPPSEALVFYQVVARNPVCGEGPRD